MARQRVAGRGGTGAVAWFRGTPEGYSERLSAAVDRMRRTSDRELRDAKEELGAAVRRVEHLAGKMHTRDEQRRWLARPQPVAS